MIIQKIIYLIALLCLNVAFTYSTTSKSNSPGDKCKICTVIVEKFQQGLLKTSKSNFGGGNTHWEEKKLGSYTFSETRFIEIVENICIEESKECHQMLEACEELLEMWWKRFYALNVNSDLREFLCVRRLKLCCPKGTYGPNCKDCKGGRKAPCNRNGRCDGDGTKEGTGECICDAGFEGDLCHECSIGFYDNNSETEEEAGMSSPLNYRPNCIPCHQACKSVCTAAGQQGCKACKDGWVMIDRVGCSDLNECEDDSMCSYNEFCINTEGSYKCEDCHKACSRCTGPLQDDCFTCNIRYFRDDNNTCIACHDSCARSCTDQSRKSCDQCRKGWKADEEGVCQDIDECQMANITLKCSNDEYCVNTIGSYKCSTCHPTCNRCYGAGIDKCKQCKDGYYRNEEGSCIDIDECQKPNEACQGSNKKCVNLPGMYRCDCTTGYKMQGGICVPASKADLESSGSSTSSSPPNNSKKTSDNFKKVKRVKKNVPFYKRDLPQYLARLAGFTVVCSLAKQKLVLQTAMTAAFACYMYYYASELDGAFKKTG